ncbi:MAG: DUF3817 domain-containing protein [Paracoccaceae bacterium]
MLGLFRKVALVEGITTLALFLVAMPLKYIAGIASLVPPVGWLHGVAFIAYVVMMVVAFATRRDVGVVGWLRTFLAAFIPFGTFLNDGWLRRLEPAHA